MAVTVKAIGGLGNQLFGYFAGLYASQKLNSSLVLDLHRQRQNHHPGSSISDFNLEAELRWSNGLNELALSFLGILPPQLKWFRKQLQKVMKIHVSGKVGFDAALDKLVDPITMLGYFQTYRYFSSPLILPPQRALTLQNPSDWFIELSKTAVDTKPTVIHVRRGDYTDSVNSSQGVLSKDYYLEGLRLILEGAEKLPEVWVFSDSLDDVRKEFGSEGTSFRYIETPKDATAAETLSIMSLASGIVISNSTFSYWAAMLGQVPKVVCPKKWFRFGEDPEDLCPPSWYRSESLWT